LNSIPEPRQRFDQESWPRLPRGDWANRPLGAQRGPDRRTAREYPWPPKFRRCVHGWADGFIGDAYEMFLAPRAVNLFLEVPQEATEGMARRKLHFASSVAPVHGLGAAAGGLGYRCRTHKLPAEFSSAFT